MAQKPLRCRSKRKTDTGTAVGMVTSPRTVELVSVFRTPGMYGRTASGVTPTIGFTGHVNDADTGLVYMQQRYYDPVAGRFLSVDPAVTSASTGSSFNRYSYAEGNPYKFIDPDGRQSLQSPMHQMDIGTQVWFKSLVATTAAA